MYQLLFYFFDKCITYSIIYNKNQIILLSSTRLLFSENSTMFMSSSQSFTTHSILNIYTSKLNRFKIFEIVLNVMVDTSLEKGKLMYVLSPNLMFF